MDNRIKKDFLKILATAPQKAIQQYINSLTDEQQKEDAVKLAKALRIIGDN